MGGFPRAVNIIITTGSIGWVLASVDDSQPPTYTAMHNTNTPISVGQQMSSHMQSSLTFVVPGGSENSFAAGRI